MQIDFELTQNEFIQYWNHFKDDILRDVDGYYVYWPTENKGCHNEHSLMILFYLLQTANYQWDQIVANDPIFKD